MKFAITILLLSAFLLVVELAAQKHGADDIIRIETALVSVPVVVRDRNGRYISNLKVEDFSVFQDGARQEISFFANAKEPLNVAVLLDTSISTSRVIAKIKQAAIEFVYLLEPRDHASIVTFDSDVNIVQRPTSSRIQLERAIRRVAIGFRSGTVMRDAVIQAAKRLLKGVTGRKAIIILTDGKDIGSYESEPRLLNTLEESDAVIYSIFYDTEMWNKRRRGGIFRRNRPLERRRKRQKRMNKEAAKYLEVMSKLTGGRFYKGKVSKLRKNFRSITSELRNQYRLGYYPLETSISGRVHKLRVKVSKKRVAVRARSTYRVK